MLAVSGSHELIAFRDVVVRADPLIPVTSGPSAVLAASVSAACSVAMGLVIAWLVHRHVVWRRSQPADSIRDQLAKHRAPKGRKLHEEDVTFVLDKDGQPRLLGEGTFGKVRAL